MIREDVIIVREGVVMGRGVMGREGVVMGREGVFMGREDVVMGTESIFMGREDWQQYPLQGCCSLRICCQEVENERTANGARLSNLKSQSQRLISSGMTPTSKCSTTFQKRIAS